MAQAKTAHRRETEEEGAMVGGGAVGGVVRQEASKESQRGDLIV